ncbi:hypothetical protein HN018_12245 [Lichenicola cladoniae]|uniref:Uncharacterized protein n=1 Tax=Lichenicola cladoniae TaxID=1484109 RepID=A0A6M8HR02_9PROT|nr:hypothetical protein [Lichenicola cladoniae]NPD68134.1 hypothetical protein [Acetobacteraceae bacterium]QKE90705.1 hypothetical protein HN018_12245 [Lichenicola cladoniae]
MSSSHQDAMAYWQRLRKDKPSNLAIGGLVIGAFVTTLSLIALVFPHSDGAMHNRGSALYWLLMLPFVLWAWDLSTFSPRSVRTIRPAAIVLPVVSLLLLVIAYNSDKGVLDSSHDTDVELWLFAIAFIITVACSLLSVLALQRSLLQSEGPDRRLMKPSEIAQRAAASRQALRAPKTVPPGRERSRRKPHKAD